MSIIAPTILANSPEQYKRQVERLTPFATRVQLDISDGSLAQNRTVALDQAWWPGQWQVDIHMMVERPTEYLRVLAMTRPSLVIVHAEAQADLPALFEQLRRFQIKCGVALLRPTVPETVAAAIQAADHVMIFSGELGKFGGTASLMQLEKIRLVKALNPTAEIGWDGGVKLDNAFMLTQGGVDVLNVGAAIQAAADPAKAFAALSKEIGRQGVL